MVGNILNLILHADKYIPIIIQGYGVWIYLILFLIVFCETGLVVVPFLPGDSLLFASGAIASVGSMNIKLIIVIFFLAAFVGDSVNYTIGYKIGKSISSRYFKKENLEKAQNFYDRHGALTIILARFMPIIRTLAPFVAGIGKMKYLKFILYNLIGGLLWVTLFVFAGYKFGSIPFVKNNFSAVTYGIIIISLLPAAINFLNNRGFKDYLNIKFKKIYMFLMIYRRRISKELIPLYTLGVLSLFAITVFGELIEDAVINNNWNYDLAAINYVYTIRTSTLNDVFKGITSTGNVLFVIAITLLIVLLLSYNKKKREAVFFASNVLGVWLFNDVLKFIFRRDRPDTSWLVNASGYSFPSGHAMTFMGLSLLLIYFILINAKNKKVTIISSLLIFTYSIFVGLSRVYVGVHYLSDVLAGWAAAFIWVFTVIIFYNKSYIKNHNLLIEVNK